MEKIPKFGIVGNAPEIKKIEVLAKIQDKFIKQNFASKKEINKLKEAGIQSSIHYPSFHQFSAFKPLNLNPAPIADKATSTDDGPIANHYIVSDNGMWLD